MSSTRRNQRAPQPDTGSERRAQKVLVALLALGVGHVMLYLTLTGDARSALKQISAAYTPAQLAAARAPGPMPEPGTEAYSPWLRGYEQHAAASDHSLHARHEGLMRYGMLASFLIAVTILGSAMHRFKREQGRSQPVSRASRSGTRRPAVQPLRDSRKPLQPIRAPVAPARVAGKAAQPVRVAPALPLREQKRYRRSA